MNGTRLYSVLGLVGALLSTPSLAATCGAEPSGFGSGAAFQSWRNWCSCMGGRPPATFNEAQRVGCRGAGTSSGAPSASGSIGTMIGKAAGQALGEALFGSPEKDAQRAAAAARAAEDAAEARRAREAADTARAAALLNQMLEVGPAPSDSPGFAGNELGLMLGDAPIPRTSVGTVGTQSVMPNRAPGHALRNDPPAVVKQPEPPAPGQNLIDQLMQDPPPTAVPPATKVALQTPKIDSFTRGFEHGSGCYSQNAGPTCSAAALEQVETCIADYRAGFQMGEKAMKTEMGNAYRAGQEARAAGERNTGAAQPGAVGTCRIEWVKAYNSGYAGGSPP